MPRYRYRGMSPAGKELEGTIQAHSQRDAVSKLREEGIFPTRVVPTRTDEDRPAPSLPGISEDADIRSRNEPLGRAHDDVDRVPAHSDDFQHQLRCREERRRRIGCSGTLAVVATLVLLAFFWPDRLAWYWALPLAILEALVFWSLCPAWPSCPSCGEDFGRLGGYCPDCGQAFPQDATVIRAYCPHCRYLVEIMSKRPMAKRYRGLKSVGSLTPLRDGISRYPKEGPILLGKYRYVPVPLRYCTHCRARLGN